MNTNDTLHETSIPQFGMGADPFKVAAERRRWWAFLDPFLTPLVEKQMLINDPARKDAPLLSMLVGDVAKTLRATATASYVGSTVSAEDISNIKFRYPNEYNLVLHAVRLSNLGKTQKEILETLKAELDKSLLQTV